MGKAAPKNVIGPVVRKIRYRSGITQAMLTSRCCRAGWDVSENTIAKIEAQIRCITDREIIFLAKALRAEVQDLFHFD
jgi:DNA-binding XRE family transcriptional regulator